MTDEFNLEKLPKAVQRLLATSNQLADEKLYRDNASFKTGAGAGLFAGMLDTSPKLETVEGQLIWATSSYGHDFDSPVESLGGIRPGFMKSQEEKRKRVKAKAEVFTPSWVVNLQNNLVDDQMLYEGSFNRAVGDEKTWEPSSTITFNEEYPWYEYVASRRLEMCCGEGPYLYSRYDAVSGEAIPLRDAMGRYFRIGILDRKLRVVTEACKSLEEWDLASTIALKSTFGYEWQGDNLVLARYNFIKTYFEYEENFFRERGIEPRDAKSYSRRLLEVARIASWQLWQMDGLKMVVPETCGDNCVACKKRQRFGHDGVLSVIKWGNTVKVFEEFLQK